MVSEISVRIPLRLSKFAILEFFVLEKHWDVYALYVYFLLFFVVNVFLYVFNFILEDFFFLSPYGFFFFPTKNGHYFFFGINKIY